MDAPPVAEATPATPLLARPVAPAPTPVLTKGSTLQRASICTITFLHLLRGVALVAMPATVLASFTVPKSSLAFLLTSTLGVRDVLLGGLLATADTRNSHEIRRALAVALFSDAADTFILIFVVASSWYSRSPIIEIICVVLLAVWEHLTLWSFGDAEPSSHCSHAYVNASYQACVREDDKRLRLDMWLADVKRAEEAQKSAMPSPLN